jgi:hypothetical protein
MDRAFTCYWRRMKKHVADFFGYSAAQAPSPQKPIMGELR